MDTIESQAESFNFNSQSVDMEIGGEESVPGTTVGAAKIKRKMKPRSKAWNYFKKVKFPIPGTTSFVEKAQCVFCKTELNADTKSNGTSALIYHANNYKKNPVRSQQTVLTYVPSESAQGDVDGSSNMLATWNFDQDSVRKALAFMIILDELPFRFVERAGFQYFMRVACPLFSIPSRWTLARDCYEMYEDERLKLKTFLKKSAARVCLTTDTWTSIQRINYLCLTAHFIDENWNLHKRILNFVPISSHRGEDIGIIVENCLASWGIDSVFTITVDNAGSNNTAVAYLKRKLMNRNGCILGGKYLHMRCIAHIINLVVVDGLKSMKNSISRIRNAVRYVRQSPSRWEKFKECVSIEKIDSKSSVCLDVRTRWNSTYLMLDAAVKFEMAFDRLDTIDPFFGIELTSRTKIRGVNDDNGDDLVGDFVEDHSFEDDTIGVPSKIDWENARRFVCFLKHFYTLIVRVSGSKYVTSNTFFTEITGILYLLEEWQQDADVEMASMAVRIRQKYDKYWGNVKKMNMIIYIAVVLDPRYKLEYLQWTLQEIYKTGDKQIEALDLGERVKTALYEMFNEYMKFSNCEMGGKREGSGTSGLQADSGGGMVAEEGGSKLISLYLLHKSRAHCEENRTELDTYLREATEGLNSEIDVLDWWRMHSPRFPILSKLARDILAVPISTVASESAFSTSGRILDAFRSSLTPRIVQGLVCTQDWIRGRTSHSHYVSVEEDLAEIEKLDEDLVKLSLNKDIINV